MEKFEPRFVCAADSDTFVGPLPFVPEFSPDQIWTTTPGLPIVEGKQAYIHPVSRKSVALDEEKLRATLAQAPEEFSEAANSGLVQLTLPTPTGDFARFKIASSPIMAPALAAQFPEIQTFSGQGIDDPAASLRFDITPAGFHAQVLSPNGTYYIDPFWHLDTSAYISYFKQDLVRSPDRSFGEDMSELEHDQSDEQADSAITKGGSNTTGWQVNKGPDGPTPQRSGTQLRVYELANAATAEYTAFYGGTVPQALAAIVTAINRVTGIYETELSIRLNLISNSASLIYTNAATDPYTNNNGNAMLNENQANVDSVIGNPNYDIGHVFSTGGGGVAGLGVVGNPTTKARGVTGSSSPIGDAFWVDYVAHEMGHQFGGSHTFNSELGSCQGNRNPTTAYEPGSGSTIQAYAGICSADDIQPNSDPYFHSVSFDQIITYVSSGVGNSSATFINTGNSVPTVNAGPDYAIPAQTPFVLRAAGSDANNNDLLTYNWEQRDLGPSITLAAADNGTSPILRSFNPTLSTDRTVPRLAQLLNNTTPVGERLPTVARTMNFRATVRDNRIGGGGVNSDDTVVTVVNTGAAFAVTSPNTAVSWAAGSTQTVTWNVAGTTAAPINTATVNIWLSTDGGLTFTQLLASNVANDGSHDIVVPSLSTTQARIRVEAYNSIYFDLSNTNFTITGGGSNTPPTITAITNRNVPANTSTGTIPFTVGDAQTAAGDLTVTAVSSNPALLPNSRITLGGSGATRTITARPSLGQYGGTTVYISVTDAGGMTTTTTFQVYVAVVIACTPIELFDGVTAPNLPSGWTSTATVGSTNWVTSTATSDSGPNNAFIPNPANVSDSQLTSPPVLITNANRTFTFRNNYSLEPTYDGGVLEISVDGGPFADLLAAGGSFLTGGYTEPIDTQYSNPIGGRSAWTGSSDGYITTTVQLPASAVGKNVRLRFRMGSDEGFGLNGWRIDTIQYCGVFTPSILNIEATDATKNEGNTGTTPFNFVVNRTNNTSDATTVQYAVTGTGASAAAASDFGGTFPSGTINFAAGETSKSIVINVSGDTQVESNEEFTVTLSGANGGTIGALIDAATATGQILNDDAANNAPTDIALSQNTIAENRPTGTTVGSLSTVDSNAGDTFTYTLVAGSGDTDNASFSIVGGNLSTAAVLNYETKPTYSVRIRSTDAGGLSTEKSFTINLIDLAEFSTPVMLGDGTTQRSNIKQLVITFDGSVTIDPGAFVVDKLGAGGGAVTISSTITTGGSGQTVVTIGFSNFTRGTSGALVDGYYRLTVDGTKISRGGQQLDTNGDGVGGDTYVLGAIESDNFFAQYGDTDGDGLVGIAEFGQFRTSFGKLSSDPGFDVRYEFEGDGVVGISDFGQFRTRFGKPKMTF